MPPVAEKLTFPFLLQPTCGWVGAILEATQCVPVTGQHTCLPACPDPLPVSQPACLDSPVLRPPPPWVHTHVLPAFYISQKWVKGGEGCLPIEVWLQLWSAFDVATIHTWTAFFSSSNQMMLWRLNNVHCGGLQVQCRCNLRMGGEFRNLKWERIRQCSVQCAKNHW